MDDQSIAARSSRGFCDHSSTISVAVLSLRNNILSLIFIIHPLLLKSLVRIVPFKFRAREQVILVKVGRLGHCQCSGADWLSLRTLSR